MAAIRSFAPFADPRGVSGCPGRGRGGVYCCRSVWVGGRSLWEDRDKPCLLSIRRHQRSIRRHQGTPISQARSAVVHDRWFREPTSLPRVPFSSASEKIPRLGTYLLFLSWHSRKAPFLEKTGRNVLLFGFFFFFPKCALFPCADQTSGLGQEALCFSRKINPSAAPGRAVFSPCPVGNRVGCFTGAAAEELSSLLSFAVSLAYSVISINISFLPTHKILKLSRWPTLQRIALDYCFVLFLPLIPLISRSLCWIIVFVGNKSWRIMFKKEF